jgi:hypothetical protein
LYLSNTPTTVAALGKQGGTMRKTNKVDLCHALESDVTSISQLTPFDRSSMVLIQDGMALLQSRNVKAFKTFGDLAETAPVRDSWISLVACIPVGILISALG